jgi:hypothetical protein
MRRTAVKISLAVACVCATNGAILSREAGVAGATRRGRMTQTKRSLAERLKAATDGLVYQSESDAPVEPFVMSGFDGAGLTPEALLAFTKRDASTPVASVAFDEFFEPLVAIEDWYGDEERESAKRFRRLKRLLATFDDVKVYRVGERSLDVYVVGKAPSGEFAGLTTKAVET